MECLPGFARSPDGLAIARRTAEMVAETREANPPIAANNRRDPRANA